MKKLSRFFVLGFIAALVFALPLMMFAQETTDVEIDLGKYLTTAAALFLTGIGGVTVLGIVQVLKAWFRLKGWSVRILSAVVSAAFVGIYEAAAGFIWYRALILWVVITLAANGIYLFPKNR